MGFLPLIRRIVVILSCLLGCFASQAASIKLKNDKLVSYVYLGKFSREQAQLVLKNTPPLDMLAVNHVLKLYKLNYKTLAPDGNQTLASGLVALPASPKKKIAIVSYQHGTRVLRSDVPSSVNEKYTIYLATFGSHGGYMTVLPDYLGLGDSDLMLHPYIDAATLASSCIDMVIAAKEFASILNYPLNDNLYLGGYSEGGFSTMVMFEALAQNKTLPVSAVAVGSAPYDWEETMHFILNEPGPRATVYLAYFYYAMQTYKNYWEGLDEIFAKPYSSLIPLLYDGRHQLPDILHDLPLEPREIFQDAFYTALINQQDRNNDALKNNFNHYDFTPNAPLLLVGTKGDRDVPYHGAEIAYDVLKTKTNSVYLKSVSDVLDHIEAAPFVLKEELDFFNRYAVKDANHK